MASSSEQERMIGGYGSDDKVELDTGNAEVTGNDTQDASLIPGVSADVSRERSNEGQAEPSGPAGADELASSETGFGKGN